MTRKNRVFSPAEEENDPSGECWEPLDLPANAEALPCEHHQPVTATIESTLTNKKRTTPYGIEQEQLRLSHERERRTHLSSSSSSSSVSHQPTAHSTQLTQRPHQKQNDNRYSSFHSMTLQRELFHQPLQLLWTRFWIYLATSCWRQYRFPLIVTATGTVLQVFTWWHYFLCGSVTSVVLSPRLYSTAIFMTAGIVCYIYVQYDPKNKDNTKDKNAILSVLDLSKYGRGLTLWWLCLPALLELRALHLLVVQLLVHHATVRTVLVTCVVLTGIAVYHLKYNNHSPRQAIYQAWAVLYVAALLVALASSLATHSGALLAPLLTCTGIFLLTQQINRENKNDKNENNERMIQQALRHGLHDVVQNVGTALQQDELLQLAMIRWIVEYWSTNKRGYDNTPATPSATNAAAPTSVFTATRPSSSSTPPNAQHGPSLRASTTTATRRSNTPSETIEWSDLFPMLTVTADQLASEVRMLQCLPENSEPPQAAPQPLSENQQQRPPLRQDQLNDDLDALTSLKSMLASMNIDEDAKPAVDAYRNAVEVFPPATRTAIVVSVLRRCPATILLVGYVLLVNSTFWSLSAVLLLLGPLVVLEYARIRMWASGCQPSCRQGKNGLAVLQALEELDSPMLILLSDDQYDPAQPPTLLIVWQNVVDSVHALEVSLTTARCVQTTAVAVDFAQNMLSLAHFGWEVSQHGWGHGLRVLVQEWIHLHSNNDHPVPARTRYTDAAQNAFRSGQTMNQNMRALWNENQGYQVVAPLLALVPALIGYGWVWGGDGTDLNSAPANTNQSTVVIEELDENDATLWKQGDLHVETVDSSDTVFDTGLRLLSMTGDSSKEDDAENSIEGTPTRDSPITQESVRSVDSQTPDRAENRRTENVGTGRRDSPDFAKGLESLDVSLPATHSLAASSAVVSDQLDDSLRRDVSETKVAKNAPASMEEKVSLTTIAPPKQSLEGSALVSAGLPTFKDPPTKAIEENLTGEILESMALCDENGCLDRSDKEEVLKQLSECDASSTTGQAWLQGTKNTLQCLLNQASMEGKCTEPGDPFDDDDDDSFEPLESSDETSKLISAMADSAANLNEGTIQSEKEDVTQDDRKKEEEENVLVKVGGGLAILGAVVGGVALVAGALKKDNDGDHQKKESEELKKR